MKEFLDRLEAYDLLNFLLPGILFSVLAPWMTGHSFIQEDLVLGLFVYYFIGLVISRFGSVVVESFLKWAGILRFAEYQDFLKAAKKDEKIVLLSRVNNMYRTLLSMIVVLILLRCYELLLPNRYWDRYVLVGALLALFLASYLKQTSYIRARVAARR